MYCDAFFVQFSINNCIHPISLFVGVVSKQIHLSAISLSNCNIKFLWSTVAISVYKTESFGSSVWCFQTFSRLRILNTFFMIILRSDKNLLDMLVKVDCTGRLTIYCFILCHIFFLNWENAKIFHVQANIYH